MPRRWVLAGFLAFAGPGCAQRSDWIEGTLVTVDVSGVWRGRAFYVHGPAGGWSELEMTLTQRGPKVTGDGRFRATRFQIEGTVRGDVLSFADTGGRLRGDVAVTADEMSGEGWTNLSPPATGKLNLKLARQSPGGGR